MNERSGRKLKSVGMKVRKRETDNKRQKEGGREWEKYTISGTSEQGISKIKIMQNKISIGALHMNERSSRDQVKGSGRLSPLLRLKREKKRK